MLFRTTRTSSAAAQITHRESVWRGAGGAAAAEHVHPMHTCVKITWKKRVAAVGEEKEPPEPDDTNEICVRCHLTTTPPPPPLNSRNDANHSLVAATFSYNRRTFQKPNAQSKPHKMYACVL